MNVNEYLRRIGIDPSTVCEPDSATLRRLQFAHCTTVPYENADIIRGKALSLREEDLYRKIVTCKKGGFCFELNGLFGLLLREIGYGVTDYAARYLRGETQLPMRRHRVLKVAATDGLWLCDVGIGEICPRYPVSLTEGLVQPQFEEKYRLEKDGRLGWVLWDLHHGQWRRFYSFTEEEWLPQDFAALCYWCEKNPDSPFTGPEMFSLKTPEGRITLDGNLYKEFRGEECTAREISPSEMPMIYRKFGLEYEG